MKNEEHYHKCIAKYGTHNQIDKAIEELAELIQALAKVKNSGCAIHKFYPKFVTQVVGEIADVAIMLEQLSLIFDIQKEIKEEKNFKIERQKDRMNGVD